MDFMFRAFSERNSDTSSRSPSSNYTYFTELAIQCNIPTSNGGRHNQFVRNQDAMIQRQLEKERIRTEILAEEAMRRELEAEVRRELVVERELELRRRAVDQCRAPPYTSYHQLERRSYKERVALPASERLHDYPRSGHGKIGGYEVELPFQGYEEELPFQRALQPLKTEVKPPSNVFKGKEQEKINLLAKRVTKQYGIKRKDGTSPIVGPSKITKKLKKEWSCDLCQISATSELGLKEHLKGRKHKSKQAELTGQKAGKIGLCSERFSNPIKPSQVAEYAVSEKLSDLLLEKSQQTSSRNETKVVECGGAVQKMANNKKMKFKFWCEMCQAGAFSEKVMNNHKKGKKHIFGLRQLGANGETIGTQLVEETPAKNKETGKAN